MRMHAAPYFYVFPVNNAFPACTHGLRRRLAPSDQPESCLIQEPDVRILWQDSRMKEWVETAGRVQKVLDVCQAEEVVFWNEKGNVQMGGWPMKGFSVAEQLQRSSAIPRISCACRCARRRLHVHSHRAWAEEDSIVDVRTVRRQCAWHSPQWKAWRAREWDTGWTLPVTLPGDDIQHFDSRWNEVLLSIREVPHNGILESLYKMRRRETLRPETKELKRVPLKPRTNGKPVSAGRKQGECYQWKPEG